MNNHLLDKIIIVIIVILTWSLIQGWLPLASRHWIWLGFGLFLLTPDIALNLKTRLMIVYGAYLTVVLTNYFLKGEYYYSISNIIMELGSMLMCWILSLRVLGKRDVFFINNVVKWSLFVICATCITTIVVDQFIPGVVRIVVEYVNGEKGEMTDQFYRMGVCEYAFPHAVPIIIPGFIFWIRNKTARIKIRILSFACLLLCLIFLFITGVSTAVFTAVLAIILSLVISADSMKKTILRMFFVGILMAPFFNKEFMGALLRNISVIIPSESNIQGRVDEIAYSFETGGENYGDLQSRENKYDISIEGFWKSPLTGTSSKDDIGEHSVLLDRFAALGILGGIPFVLYFFLMSVYIYRHIEERKRGFFLCGMGCFAVMIATKNMSNIYTWLYIGVLLPSMLMYSPNRVLKRSKI